MDKYLKEIIKNLEIKENYIDNEGCHIEYVETEELNKIFNNVVSKQKVKEKIEEIKEDKESKYFDTFLMARDINYAIDILKELLEDN